MHVALCLEARNAYMVKECKPQNCLSFPQINLIGEPFLNFNSDHLRQFDANLYRQLTAYPQEVIPTLDMAVNEMFFERYPDTSLEHQIQVRPFNMEKTNNMRSLDPEGGLC